MISPADRRSNPSEKHGVVGTTASSAALVVAQQEADFAVASDHLAGARVSALVQRIPVSMSFLPVYCSLSSSAPVCLAIANCWFGVCCTCNGLVKV